MELRGTVGVPLFDRGKRSAGFTEKNFRAVADFFACCFLLNLPVPNETPAAEFRLTDNSGMWLSVISGNATVRGG